MGILAVVVQKQLTCMWYSKDDNTIQLLCINSLISVWQVNAMDKFWLNTSIYEKESTSAAC